MAYLLKKEVEDIIKKAPAGTTPEGIVAALRQQGHQLEGYTPVKQGQVLEQDPNEKNLLQRAVMALGDFTGVTALGKGVAASINKTRNQTLQNKANAETDKTRNDLVAAIKKNTAEGKDTIRLERALAQLNEASGQTNQDFRDLADLGVTNRDVVGSAVRTAATIASFGTYGQAAQGASSFSRLRNVPGLGGKITGATSVVRGIIEGAKTGAVAGAKGGGIFGALQGLGLGIQDEQAGLGEIAGKTIGGGITGAIGGGITGGIVGGGMGGYQARQNFKAELQKSVANSNAPYVERIKNASNDLAKELGDNVDEVKLVEVRNRIKSSEALPIDRAIKAGDITPEQVYSDPIKKVLQPNVATGRIADVQQKLNMAQPGLGDKWATTVDAANTTYDDIITSGLKTLDEAAGITERVGKTSASAATYKIDPKTGKIVSDVSAVDLMKTTGLSADDVAVMKSGTTADKQALKSMVEMAGKNVDDPLGRTINRPESVVGKTALKRINDIRGAKEAAGANINSTVRTKLADKSLDTSSVYDDFVKSLIDDGVDVLDDGTLKFSPDSRYGRTPTAQKTLKTVNEVAKSLRGETSAVKAHNLKNQLDEILDYGNNTDKGISGQASRIAKGLRNALDTKLDDTYPAYKAANDQYRIAKTALGEVESVLGKNYYKEIGASEGSNDLVAQRLGTIFRRINSNAPDSALRLSNALDEAAANLGIKNNDSLTVQSYFSTIVNELYPENIPRNSLAGQVKLGTSGAQKFKGLRNLASAPIDTTANAVLDAVEAGNPEKQAALLKYLEQLLVTPK